VLAIFMLTWVQKASHVFALLTSNGDKFLIMPACLHIMIAAIHTTDYLIALGDNS